MKKIIYIASLGLLAAAGNLYAQVPNLLTYQGRLKESGQAITGTRLVDVMLCDADTYPAGTCHSQGAQTVNVSNGLFRSTFTVPSDAVISSGDWYLEIWVNGARLAPRERLTSSAYAILAGTATYSYSLAAAPGADGVYISTNVHLTAGKYYGDGSQLSNLPVAGGAMANPAAQNLDMSGFQIVNLSSLTAAGLLGAPGVQLAGNVLISSEASPALGAGVRVSTNIYIVGFSSAAKYYGDGSELTGINAATIADGSITAVKLSVPAIDGSGKVAGLNSTYLASLDGSALTSLNPASIGAGTLGTNVIASSAALNAVYTGALQDNSVTSAKIADGAIIAADIAVSTISLDRLNQSGCTGGQIPKWNGSAWACAADDAGTSYAADELSLHLSGPTFSALASSVTLQGNAFNGAAQLVKLDGSGYLPALNGSALTNLAPANIANGTLGAGVIVSSVGASGVRPGSIAAGAVADADINPGAAIAISKLASSGALGANVIASSVAVDAVYTGSINDNSVTSAKIADGAIIAADIAVSTISLDRLNQSGCTGGQVPKWNGSAWACANDAGDNLGNHVATTTLQMGSYGIVSSSDITAAHFQIGGETVLRTIGSGNNGTIVLGQEAAGNGTPGSDNTIIGSAAMNSAGPSAQANTAVGSQALFYNSGGSNNTAIGYEALTNEKYGASNIAIGDHAGYGGASLIDVSSNTLVGAQAGYSIETGAQGNVLIGFNVGPSLNNGTGNIVIGAWQDVDDPDATDQLNIGGAIYGDLSSGNIGIGVTGPLYKLEVQGDVNLSAGSVFRVNGVAQSGLSDWTQGTGDDIYKNSGSVGIGTTGPADKLQVVGGITASSATFDTVSDVGLRVSSSAYLATAGGNVGIGTASPESRLAVSSGAGESGNILVISTGTSDVIRMTGAGEIYANKFYGNISGATGFPPEDNMGSEIASTQLQMGNYAIMSSSSINAAYYQINGSTVLAVLLGSDNLGVGIDAGWSTITGTDNVFIGKSAGFNSNNTNNNVFVGSQSGYNGGQDDNAFLGYQAGYDNLNSNNTFIGFQAGYSNGDGTNNSFLGYKAGFSNTSGSGNIVIGAGLDVQGGVDDQLNIGGVIFGDLSAGNVGIGTTVPLTLLDVAGGIGTYSRTKAQLMAITPTAAGQIYYCSDCTPAKLVVSTGTSTGNFATDAGAMFQ